MASPPEAPPGWLLAEVIAGMQRLMLLALPGAPAFDAMEGVARAWADALMAWPVAWDAHQDARRLQRAFRLLAASAERWPAPVHLRRLLPPRPPQPALPAPATDNARARARLAEILARMGAVLKAPEA